MMGTIFAQQMKGSSSLSKRARPPKEWDGEKREKKLTNYYHLFSNAVLGLKSCRVALLYFNPD